MKTPYLDALLYDLEAQEFSGTLHKMYENRLQELQAIKAALQELEELKAEKESIDKCSSCGVNDSQSDHTCPYQEDVNNNSFYLCNCCSDCKRECLEDI